MPLEPDLVHIKLGAFSLSGNLQIPPDAQGIVVFAHGSGSSRHSPRNQFVAEVLRKANLATLLIDLLTQEEETRDIQTTEHRFNISLLAKRLSGIVDWLRHHAATKDLKIGYFGASTGAAAALVAAAEKPLEIAAIVSRGGRPDLAGPALPRVQAPTLLIVGGADYPVIKMNEEAFRLLMVEKQLVIVPDATHLFEEPGALEEVARLASEWFRRFLGFFS